MESYIKALRILVTLVPKKDESSELTHFRPISLGCVYKLIAKVLAERLKVVLSEIIGESQGAFLEDRQILDGVLIINELTHMHLKDKKPGPLFKIYMEKAYGYVDWSFVSYLFDKMGFSGYKWKKWMKSCVEDTPTPSWSMAHQLHP